MQEPDKEPVPIWRQRLVSMLVHEKVPASIKADIKAALDEIDHLKHAISVLKD